MTEPSKSEPSKSELPGSKPAGTKGSTEQPTRDKNRFGDGDMALLLDRKNRSYLVTLSSGQIFHSHLGQLGHDQLIESKVGGWFRTDRGHTFLAVRPTLAEYVLKMPRGPQIIYPKDLGNIITLADIFPGATVVEAGLGSGSLTTALLRAVGSAGRVYSYEINEPVVAGALKNIQKVVPDISNLIVGIGDIYESIPLQDVDRVVLDVPEPWQAVPHVADALVMGGILLSFLPTILQVHHLVNQLREDGRFQMIEMVETLLRPWHVTERSVRPVHRMVAHSGFLTTAVRCEPKIVGTVSNPIVAAREDDRPAPENEPEPDAPNNDPAPA